MLGWGTHFVQSFSKRRKFLHVVKTYIRAYNLQATIGLENSKTISTTPDVALGVRKYRKIMSSRLLIIFGLRCASDRGLLYTGCPVNWYSLSISIPDFSDCPIKKI